MELFKQRRVRDEVLIDEFLEFSLPDAIRKTPGPSRESTRRDSKDGTELREFADTFIKVLKSTFGSARPVSATVYTEPNGADPLPVRMLTIHLGRKQRPLIKSEETSATGLLDEMSGFHRDLLKKKGRTSTDGGMGFQRVAFLFHSADGKDGNEQNLTIIKPDECRYWTKSQAMRDADELAGSIVNAAQRANASK